MERRIYLIKYHSPKDTKRINQLTSPQRHFQQKRFARASIAPTPLKTHCMLQQQLV